MTRGFSLIELLIVASVTSIFFGGFFLTIQHSLNLVSDSRSRMTALSVANDEIEYIRSLSYDAVGTVSGLPPGIIPQTSTTSLNQKIFTKRVLIEYIDDAADGIGGADSNAITTDYKRAKVEISWTHKEQIGSVILVSNIIPNSIETNEGGGTVRVYVKDANVLPVAGASVRLVNTTGTSSVDVTKFTDATGEVLFGGAPAGAGYEIFVSKVGYSSDQTRTATTSLPNPSLQPIAVTAAELSTMDFQIDRTSTIDFKLLSDYNETSLAVTFASSTEVATSTDIFVTQSETLTLASTSGSYVATGFAMVPLSISGAITAWQSVDVNESIPVGTSRLIKFYSGTTLDTLIPDTDLPNNSTGFAETSIDISTLDATLYPDIVAGVTLSTTNAATSSLIDTLTARYVESETPRSSTNVTVHSAKTIGTLTDFSPVYKHDMTIVTDSDGAYELTDIEWDTYTFAVAGSDIEEACTTHPFSVAPNVNEVFILVTAPNTSHSLRVEVTNGGSPVRDAVVTLRYGGDTVQLTSGCGQTFFGGLTEDTSYVLEVAAPGYTTVVVDPLTISGDVVEQISL